MWFIHQFHCVKYLILLTFVSVPLPSFHVSTKDLVGLINLGLVFMTLRLYVSGKTHRT